jgi:excisionase family DNA binding protein
MGATEEILLSGSEAATLLRILRARLLRLARRGEVPHILLPDGEIRFRRADLVAWVATYERPADQTEAAK